MTASFFEVLTSTGKYFWIPLERVELVEFRPPERPRDLLWRPVHMIVRGGPDGEVYLPVLYAGSAADADDQIRLGRTTEWRGDAGAGSRLRPAHVSRRQRRHVDHGNGDADDRLTCI